MKITKKLIIGIATASLLVVLVAFTIPFSENEVTLSDSYSVESTWKMPESLNEISGIVWIGNNKVACVQDEEGIIFIYDLTSKEIIENHKFAGAGDYEAIAINKSTAYIMRSDGTIFEVENYDTAKTKTIEHTSEFSSNNNMESLFFDTKTSKLITAPKEVDIDGDTFKSIYEITLDTKKASSKQLFKIDMNDDALKKFQKKKSNKNLMPSEVAVHPITNEIYILEGKDAKLLVLDKSGKIKKVHQLDKDIFPQPEGMTFSENGTLYISNEANKGTATILEVSLK